MEQLLIVFVLRRLGELILLNFTFVSRAVDHGHYECLEADDELGEEHVKGAVGLMPLEVTQTHPIVLLHAAEALINVVEGPNVKVLDSATELMLFVKEVDRDTPDGQFSVLFEYQSDRECHTGLDRNLTVPQ